MMAVKLFHCLKVNSDTIEKIYGSQPSRRFIPFIPCPVVQARSDKFLKHVRLSLCNNRFNSYERVCVIINRKFEIIL